MILPRGVAGTDDEPANADAGTLSFDATTDTARIKLSTGWSDLVLGGGGGGGGELGAYIQAPATPNASFDDEFDSGSADLASRGWTFRNITTATTMTRLGEIYPFQYDWLGGVGVPTANQYRSSIVNSRLLLQLPVIAASNEYHISKAVTLPALSSTDGGLLWARVSQSRAAETGFYHNLTAICFWDNSAGLPDANNFNYVQMGARDANYTQYAFAGVVGGGQTATTHDFFTPHSYDTLCMITTDAWGTKQFMVDSTVGHEIGSSLRTAGYRTAATIGHAGFSLRPFNGGTGTHAQPPGLWCIDYIRLKIGNIQTLCSSAEWLF